VHLSPCGSGLLAASQLNLKPPPQQTQSARPAALIICQISEKTFMDIRSLQRPLKDHYRQDPASSRITLTARGTQTDAPISCSVDLGRAIYSAQAHKGVGGAGTGACSGDLLLGALAACAQITCQMVAAAMAYLRKALKSRPRRSRSAGNVGNIKRGTRGFESIRVIFDVRAHMQLRSS